MTVIDVDVSSLRAAREWRGISIAVAARTSGLGLMQAEALEDGNIELFGSVDEMIAAAVLYGSSLGIGRDEAMALLDRTMQCNDEAEQAASQPASDGDQPGGVPVLASQPSGTDSDSSALTPSVMQQGTTADFSAAVQSKSLGRVDAAAVPAVRTFQASIIAEEGFDAAADLDDADSTEITGDIPVITDDQLVDQGSLAPNVSAAMHLDQGYRAAWEQAQSEFAAWEAVRLSGLPANGGITGKIAPGLEKLLGERRAESVVRAFTRAEISTRNGARSTRSWLQRSEHATLIVAVGVGIVLIALLVAIASAFNNDAPTFPKSATSSPEIIAPGSPAITDGTSRDTASADTATTKPAKPVAQPVVPPRKIHLQVLNTGRQKGYARQIADGLLARGYKIDVVGNSKTNYGSSVILYPAALEREAIRLSKETRITTMDQLPAARATANSIVVVVH